MSAGGVSGVVRGERGDGRCSSSGISEQGTRRKS